MENVLKVCDVKLTYKTKVKSSERPVIVLAEDVYRLLIDYVYDKEIIQYKECLKLILLNKAGKLLGVHPSGNLKPSTQDDLVTENLRKAAKLFNITLLDHIIVTDSGYFSYLDEGRVL